MCRRLAAAAAAAAAAVCFSMLQIEWHPIRLFVPDCCGDHSFRSPRPDSTLAFPLPLPAALVLPATTRGSGGSGGSPPLSLALALALPLALAPALAALLRSQHVEVVGKTVRVRLPRPLDTTKNIAKTTN